MKDYKVLCVHENHSYIEDRDKVWRFSDNDPRGIKLQEQLLMSFGNEGWRLISTAAASNALIYLYLERDT